MRVKGYWVYTVTCPDGCVYVGMSSRELTSRRWKKLGYESTSLWDYIELWGWDNLKKEVIKEGLTKEEAFDLEEELISFCELNGVCINQRHSGGVTLNENGVRDLNAYHKGNGYKYQHRYFERHREEHRARCREYMRKHSEEQRIRCREYIRNHREEHNKRCLNNYYKKKWARQLTELGYIPLF